MVVQPGLGGAWSETQKTGFLTTRLIFRENCLTLDWRIRSDGHQVPFRNPLQCQYLRILTENYPIVSLPCCPKDLSNDVITTVHDKVIRYRLSKEIVDEYSIIPKKTNCCNRCIIVSLIVWDLSRMFTVFCNPIALDQYDQSENNRAAKQPVSNQIKHKQEYTDDG